MAVRYVTAESTSLVAVTDCWLSAAYSCYHAAALLLSVLVVGRRCVSGSRHAVGERRERKKNKQVGDCFERLCDLRLTLADLKEDEL